MATSSPLESVPLDPQVRSFFHAIKENPDDDTPRLIFADWLQEHGNAADAARGEYLRLSVLRHRLSPDDPSYDLMKRREGELFREHCWAWLGPLVDAAKTWTFERGMIQVVAEPERITKPEVRVWARTSAALWIDSLAISQFARGRIIDLAFSPPLEHINRLDLSGNGNIRDLEYLFRLFRAQRMLFLKRLRLARCRLGQEQVRFSDRSRELLSRLTFLDLSHNLLDDTAARLLAESPCLKKIAELRLGHNSFTLDGMVLLRQAFGDRVHF